MPDFGSVLSIFESTIRLSVPLMLAALGGMFSERAGIVDFSLEGKLLASAFAAALVASLTGSPSLAVVAGAVAGASISALHGFATVTERGDHTISCVGLNFIVIGLTATIALSLFHIGGQTPLLGAAQRVPSLGETLGIDGTGSQPIAALLSFNVLVYVTALVFAAAGLLFATRYGLYITAAGENPHALDAAGLSVARVRYFSLMTGGAICGIGGAYLSIAQNAQFVPLMSAGKGYIALAVLIFAKWRIAPIVLVSLGFGFLDAFEARLQGVAISGIGVLPVQFVQALPYIITIVVLAGVIGGARAPEAIGKPYVR